MNCLSIRYGSGDITPLDAIRKPARDRLKPIRISAAGDGRGWKKKNAAYTWIKVRVFDYLFAHRNQICLGNVNA